MDDQTRKDIRRLLKTFGIKADEAIMAHLERYSQVEKVRVRLVLEDLTDYGEGPPEEPLHLQVEGEVRH